MLFLSNRSKSFQKPVTIYSYLTQWQKCIGLSTDQPFFVFHFTALFLCSSFHALLFHVALSSMRFFHVFLCCTLFILFLFDVALFSCCTHVMLHFFCIETFSYCTLFILCFFYVTQSYLWCTLFLLNCFYVALTLGCFIFMLRCFVLY